MNKVIFFFTPSLNIVYVFLIFLFPEYVALQVYVFDFVGALIVTFVTPFFILALYVLPLIINLTIPELTFLVPYL